MLSSSEQGSGLRGVAKLADFIGSEYLCIFKAHTMRQFFSLRARILKRSGIASWFPNAPAIREHTFPQFKPVIAGEGISAKDANVDYFLPGICARFAECASMLVSEERCHVSHSCEQGSEVEHGGHNGQGKQHGGRERVTYGAVHVVHGYPLAMSRSRVRRENQQARSSV
jgi:hypothetical protein